jgi:hypothetical protein
MFEKPYVVIGNDQTVRIQISQELAETLLGELKVAGFDGFVSASEITYSNPGKDNPEKVAVIDVTKGEKSAVLKFLRKRQ